MDLFVAALIVQDAQYAARKAAAHRASPPVRRSDLLSFLMERPVRF